MYFQFPIIISYLQILFGSRRPTNSLTIVDYFHRPQLPDAPFKRSCAALARSLHRCSFTPITRSQSMSDASATKVVALGSVDRWCPSGDRKISQIGRAHV